MSLKPPTDLRVEGKAVEPPPPPLTYGLASISIGTNYTVGGIRITTGEVRLTEPAKSVFDVKMTSSHPSIAWPDPALIRFVAGQVARNFWVRSNVVTAPVTVTITATAEGRTRSLQVSILTAADPVPEPDPKEPPPPPPPPPPENKPLEPSTIAVRADHPRMHFTPEQLPVWRTYLAGPFKQQFQWFVNTAASQVVKENADLKGTDKANYVDYYALIWLAGNVPGINFGPGLTPESYAAKAVLLLREMTARTLPLPGGEVNLASVNHPFHGAGAWFEICARAHDWLWHYPGYTDADKRATAAHLMEWCRLQLEVDHPNTPGKAPMRWTGPADAFEGSPGAEMHHPWYYILPVVGDGMVNETKARQYLAAFDTHWLQGGWLDASHWESQGYGTRALGGYSGWYPERLILNFHAWKTATGKDYFNDPTPLSPDPWYFKGIPIIWSLLQKPQNQFRSIPLGQASGDQLFPASLPARLTGLLSGPEKHVAAYHGLPLPSKVIGGIFPELLTADPTVTPKPLDPGIYHVKTWGIVFDKRADGTVITMSAPVIRMKGHTWHTQGGGHPAGIPLGVTLQVKKVPVLVKHVGSHRGNVRTFGQNTVRFYDPLLPKEVNGVANTEWLLGGLAGNTTAARRTPEIKYPGVDDLGGIKSWTPGDPNRAVATLTKWYDPKRVKSYVRTYEWGSNSLRVIDQIETARPDILVWSRWYTGHVPTVGGVGVPVGFHEQPVPAEIMLGPVRWKVIDRPAGTVLKTVGGKDFEWVNDLDSVLTGHDQQIIDKEGVIEIGQYTITFKSVGSGRWEHLFTW